MKAMLKAIGGRVAPALLERYSGYQLEKLRARIDAIVSDPAEPDTTAAEAKFDELQQRYPKPSEYGYDNKSTWSRASSRVTDLLQRVGFSEGERSALEIGCGDGITGLVLSTAGFKVTLADMEDWRDRRTSGMEMLLGHTELGLPLESESMDLVYSYNSMEHVENPVKVFDEMFRVCRSGGFIYLDFGPLYCSPWGLHAGRSLYMPYPQFLFSESFLNKQLARLGIWDLGRKRSTLQPLNRWRMDAFESLWRRLALEVEYHEVVESFSPSRIIFEFPNSFRGRKLSSGDLVNSHLRVLLKKRSA